MSKSYELATVARTCRRTRPIQVELFVPFLSLPRSRSSPRPWFQRPAVVFSLACSWLPLSLHAVRLALLARALTTFRPSASRSIPLSSLSCRLPGSLSRSAGDMRAVRFLPERFSSSFYRFRGVCATKQYSSTTCFFRRACPLCSPGRQTDTWTHGQTNFR